MKNTLQQDAEPWYRIPQVWLIITFPSLAVIGGVITIWLAISTDDGLVTDNYYRKGLAINQTLQLDKQAIDYQLFGQLKFEQDNIQLQLSGQLNRLATALPDVLNLQWQHATKAGYDQTVVLQQSQSGLYQGNLIRNLTQGRWYLQIQQDDWRLRGQLQFPQQNRAVLSGFDAQ